MQRSLAFADLMSLIINGSDTNLKSDSNPNYLNISICHSACLTHSPLVRGDSARHARPRRLLRTFTLDWWENIHIIRDCDRNRHDGGRSAGRGCPPIGVPDITIYGTTRSPLASALLDTDNAFITHYLLILRRDRPEFGHANEENHRSMLRWFSISSYIWIKDSWLGS